MPRREGIYGLLAEFDTPGELVHAAEQARHAAGAAWSATRPIRWKKRRKRLASTGTAYPWSA